MYQGLYEYFNKKLFKNQLPFCLLILSRNAARVCGHFSKDRWKDREGNTTHEINLNPVYMAMATDLNICQTLVHEMCHLWQYEFGKPSRAGYHNKEWARKMQTVGLMPSHTGKPGGNMTGQQMDDYPIEKGVFEKAFKKMPKHLLLPFKSSEFTTDLAFLDALMQEGGTDENSGGSGGQMLNSVVPLLKPKKKTKIKYTCQHCKANAWGKPNLELLCKTCVMEHLSFHGSIEEFQLENYTMYANG